MAKVEFLANRCNDMRHYIILCIGCKPHCPLTLSEVRTHTPMTAVTHTGSQIILYFLTIIIITHYNSIIVWNLKFDKKPCV